MLQRRSDKTEEFDVIVVGARCAGSPLATLLARQGFNVCVVDRDEFPSDTPSTHGIQPSGVQMLERLGVLGRILEVGAAAGSGFIAFNEHRVTIEDTAAIVGAPMVNARRVTLDAILLDAARDAGAEVRTGTPVTGLLTASGRVTGVRTAKGDLRARLVVGADGARSAVARLVGAEEYQRTPAQRVFLWSYFEGVEASKDRVWLGGIGEDGFLASPTDAGLFLAAFVAPLRRRDEVRADRTGVFEDGVRRWPELRQALAPARRAGPVHSMTNWHGFFRRSAGPGWVLVGDAGHFKDPTAGQGISDALRQVEKLAPAIGASLAGGGADDAPLLEWWHWRDEDAWEMYWFAQDIGASWPLGPMDAVAEARIASDPAAVERLLRVLNHELPPSKFVTPAFGLSIVAHALRERRGQRLAVLGEARDLAAQEFRRTRLRRKLPTAG
jgi:2-polyprenyl-6-methoxyphenol hydroxylase-like FAD-dependent oxidoreductase